MQSTDPFPAQGFTGTISLQLTDLIQMVCLSRSDLVIDIISSKGKGSIHIRDGRIHHAQTDQLTGTEAFFEVLQWDDGQFEILPFVAGITDSINKPWEHLLLEAMRLQDEKKIESHGREDGTHQSSQFEEKPGPDILVGIDEVLSQMDFACFPDEPKQKKSIACEVSHPPLKILIVDDSAVISKKLKDMLEFDDGIEVVGTARNGKEGLEFLESGVHVDLITLDFNMPVMLGDTTLKHIMIRFRVPVVIISSLEPHSMHKIFDFLQLGAVDYLAKPTLHDDMTSYGENLRKLVRGVAKAQVSNFRRLRTINDSKGLPVQTIKSTEQKIVVIVGAEGAYIDWLRLPLRRLCSHGPVIGLQKLDHVFAPQFARLIEDKTGVKTENLTAGQGMAPGKFYLVDARREAELKVRSDKFIHVNDIGSTVPDWESGIELWLERLAEQARDSLCIYFLSAARSLPETLLTKLLDCNVRHFLSPPQSVVCSQMIDSIQPYAALYPDLVLHASPDTLSEVL